MGLTEVRERTAARKAAGANQTYPRHAGRRDRRGPRRAALPCLDAAELTGRQREAAGLSHARRWNRCGNPALPLGKEYVCPCQGCGPTCPGYRADPAPRNS